MRKNSSNKKERYRISSVLSRQAFQALQGERKVYTNGRKVKDSQIFFKNINVGIQFNGKQYCQKMDVFRKALCNQGDFNSYDVF